MKWEADIQQNSFIFDYDIKFCEQSEFLELFNFPANMSELR